MKLLRSALLSLLMIVMVDAFGKSDDEFKRISELSDELMEEQSFSYFFQLLNGLKADNYVPGSINCSLDIIATHADIVSIIRYFSDENEVNRPENTKQRTEEAIFLVYREIVQNLPRTIYDCYFIPQVSAYMWRQHLTKFQDMEDFEAGFIQNMLGQVLSIQDALHKISEASKEKDTGTMIYQVGRLGRRIFDFEPMKSASLHPKLTTVSSPFEKRTVKDMRKLHSQIISSTDDFDNDQKTSDKQHPRLRQSNFVSNVDIIEAPFYAALGFIEGAFTPQSVNETGQRNETSLKRNVTECRINTIRFINNLTYFAWYSELDYGIDRIMLFGTESATASYQFSRHCYFAVDEAVYIATTTAFMAQEWDVLVRDSVYEMRSHTDAARRIYKMVTEILEARQAKGSGFLNKDFYVIGQQMGLIFNNISSNGDYIAGNVH